MTTRITRHELVARRLALGLSQSQLANVLPFKQSNLSQIERGLPAHNPREMRPWFDERLSELEYTLNELIDITVTAVEAADGPVTLHVHDTDAALWAAHPSMDGIPTVLHQVAMARALWELRAAGHDVQIDGAPGRGDVYPETDPRAQSDLPGSIDGQVRRAKDGEL